jgi:hypothetical protein
MSRINLMKSKYVLAATLVLSGFATGAAMAQQHAKKPITNKHPVHAIVERHTEPERNCTATAPILGHRGNPQNRTSAANPSGLPWCGGGMPDFGN